MLPAILLITFILLALPTLRLLYILPVVHSTRPPPPQKHHAAKHLMLLLGSGGHTAEMLLLLASLSSSPSQHVRRTYIVTSGDTLSIQKAAAYENVLCTSRNCSIRIVPRARRVGQSWLSTPWDCLLCLAGCFRAFVDGGVPDVLVCNGPGSAVLMVLVALGGRFLGLAKTRTLYVESFARTRSLSLSGKLLYPLVDRFFVQWPKLKERYPRAEYRGILV